MSRVSAAADTARSLEEFLASPLRGGHDAVDPDGLLVPAATALLAVVQRSGGGELLLSAGPDHSWAVRIFHDGTGPVVELVQQVSLEQESTVPPGPIPTPVVDPSDPGPGPRPEVAAELAELLRTRKSSA
ncbi:MAG: hypothetical protein LH603_08800 [Pseudonocardia sp.]|nr:hypothetical protein [Pseudonocardia sp.]